jgi:enterochelin esterase-like enzyme
MPGFEEPAHLKEGDGLAGKLETFDFESKITENSRKITVYLPPGYDESGDAYPALYVHYGQMAQDMGKLHVSLDNLIGKSVAPVIAVFVHMNPEARFREVSSEPYLKMMAEELVPHIDSRYRTKAEASARALSGGASGGYASVLGAITYPGVFGMAGGQSCNIDGNRKASLLETIRKAGKQDVRFYLDWGLYDLRNEDNELNRAADSRELTGLLVDQGYRVDGGQVNQGYNWDNWRLRYHLMLESLFPLDPVR